MPTITRAEHVDPETTAKFWAFVDRSDIDGCWPWTRTLDKRGRGLFLVAHDGRTRSVCAHRLAYIFVRGEIRTGGNLKNRCGRRACCNPRHWGFGPAPASTVVQPVVVPGPPTDRSWREVVEDADARPNGPVARRVAAAIRAVLEPEVRRVQPDVGEPSWVDLVAAAMSLDATADELCTQYLAQYRLAGTTPVMVGTK